MTVPKELFWYKGVSVLAKVPNQYPAGTAKPKLDYMKDELIEMYQSGMSMCQIAKEISEYQQQVATTLKRYITLRQKK